MPCLVGSWVWSFFKNAECEPENGETERRTETERKQLHQTVHRRVDSVHTLLSKRSGCDLGMVWNKWRLEVAHGSESFEKYPPRFCVVKGCRVNLRDLKPIGYNYRRVGNWPRHMRSCQATCHCHAHVRIHMHHVKDEWLENQHNYCTDDFARRVCKTILEDIGSQDLRAEVTGHSGVPKEFLRQTKGCSCEAVMHPRSELRCNQCEMKWWMKVGNP